MKSTALIQIAGKSIIKNKMRTLLTMLGIIIGVSAVIVMVAIGSGAQAQIEQQVKSLGTNMIVITPGAATAGGVSQGAQTMSRLTTDDTRALRAQGTNFSGISPVIATRAQIVASSGNWRANINGVDVDYQTIREWPTSDGMWFEANDVQGSRKVALLGKTVADNLFPNGDAVGQQIRLGAVPFEVIGVLIAKGQTAEGRDQDDVVLAPYTTVQTRLSGRTFIPQILVSTFSSEQIAAAQAEVRSVLRDSHKLTGGDADDFTVKNQAELADAASGTTRVMTLLLAAIASISLLVGGIGIMNIMLVSVTERTREIGLRLAMGARGNDVLKQFLVESLVMGIVGGLIGLVVGVGGSTAVAALTGWSTRISPITVVGAITFAGMVGVFFGYYPARRAARLDPIEALRFE